jgi:hypothetical protein
MDMPLVKTSQPWILGSLAVYAPTLSMAWQVHDLVTANEQPDAFGTVTLLTGEEIDWIDMSYRAMLRRHGRSEDNGLTYSGPAQDMAPVS